MEHLRQVMPAALVPRLAEVPSLPTMTSGKVDRGALPWPLATDETHKQQPAELHGTAAWVAELWLEVVGAVVTDEGDDFFDLGGGSLTAAQMVSRLRGRYPEVTVADLYENPTVRALAGMLDEMATPAVRSDRSVRPTPSKTQIGQIVFTIPLRLLSGLRWVTWVMAGSNLRLLGARPGLPAHVLVVVGRARLGAAGLGPGSDGPDGRRGADPAAQGGPGRLPAWWPHPPEALAGRAAGRRARCREPRRRGLDADVRPGPRRQGRQAGRPALDPAGHRHAHPRQRLLGGARGRPLRPLARRRRAAHRPDQGRCRRPGGHPQHARARGGRRSRGRGRARVGRDRHRHEAGVLDRLARRARRPHPWAVEREPARAQAALGGGVRRHRDADLAAPDRRRAGRARGRRTHAA